MLMVIINMNSYTSGRNSVILNHHLVLVLASCKQSKQQTCRFFFLPTCFLQTFPR